MTCKRLFIPVALLALIGCGKQLVSDQAKAETSLRTALDVWKEGKPSTALNNLSPAIQMNEAEWTQGVRLVAYKMDGSSEYGRRISCAVDLTFIDVHGQTHEKRAVYLVGMNGAQTLIVRQNLIPDAD